MPPRSELTHAIASGQVKPRVDQAIAWTDVRSVYATVSANAHLGTVVLKVRNP